MEQAYSNSYEKQAFLFSFLIHSTLFGSYLLYHYHNPIEIKSKSEVISMHLASFELPKQNVVEPIKPIEKSKPIEKKIEKVKPKPIEKIKPIEKTKPLIPIKPLEKPIEKPQEIEKVEISQPIQEKISKSDEQKRIEKEHERKAHEQNFVRTNFAIIRDKVLNNLIYPNIARRMSWVGVVELAIIIDTNGKLLDAYIHKSSNRKLLDDAALEAAMRLKNDTLPKPKTVSKIILPVSFKLK
jgi:protein TonB